jgi:hypothetical protein
MNTLHVWPQAPQICDGEVRLRAIFDGFDSGSKAIEIAVQQSALPYIPSRSDHFAFAALFPAMRSFDACVIHGQVSRSLLTNISELNAFWQFWRPQIYRQVGWETDKVAEKSFISEQRSGHLLAFSGGVDSSATLRRHASKSLGWRNRRIGAALIVHGFDIPASDTDGFKSAYEKAERITSSVGVPLTSARTNLRELPDDWEDAFATKLASVLHVFNETFEGAVFAADEPYAFPTVPWGSNPVSNQWLGTHSFPVRPDGAELSRLQKIKFLSEWEAAVNNIRVCWEGSMPGENCGRCEKCVRTQLQLIALGKTPRGNFKVHVRPGMVIRIRPPNKKILHFLSELLDYCNQNNLSTWWTDELRKVVRRGCSSPVRFQALRQTILWRGLRKIIKPKSSVVHDAD